MNLFYGFLLSLFWGVIAAGQILGFIGIYNVTTAVDVSLILTFIAMYLYGWENTGNYDLLKGWKQRWDTIRSTSPLEIAFYAASVCIFIVLIAQPLLRWPFSPLGRSLTWDAGAYHFPKAVELFRSGSAWDLSVAYGEYPFGYESLLSLCLSLTQNESLFGIIHMAIAAFFCLTVWMLTRRYTGLPGGFLLFFSVCLLAGGILAGGERTWLLSGYALTVGKNDFLLGAASLSVILHSPVGSRKDQNNYQLFCFAMASMVALAVKPNALGIIAPMALLILCEEWRKIRRSNTKFPWLQLILAAITASPAVLWAVRNIIVLGAVVTPAAAQLQAESIASNLKNPYLYSMNFPFLMLLAILMLLIASIIAVRFIPALSFKLVAVFCLLFITFTITPATAFHRQLDVPSHIAWRFGVALLAYAALIALIFFQTPLKRLLQNLQGHTGRAAAAAVLVCIVSAGIVWRGKWITAFEPQNDWILHDQFSTPVGTDGYYSAYDFVQKEIHHAVIHIENGLAYYLYGEDFSNTPTKLQYPLEMADQVPQPVPDYFVIFKPDWQAENPQSGYFPPSLESENWLSKWKLIYDDGEGRVYRVAR